MGLKFKFGPDSLEEDSWREQRFILGDNYPEIWIKYDLYIPENFRHRCPVGMSLEKAETGMMMGDILLRVIPGESEGDYSIPDQDSWGVVYQIDDDAIYVDKFPSYFIFLNGHFFRNQRTGVISQIKKRLGFVQNNKFFMIWQGTYGQSGNMLDFEYWSAERGNSHLSHHLAGEGHIVNKEQAIIDKDTDAGKWMEIIYHLKIAGPSDDNGIIHIWKNGQEYTHITDLSNYSESGFNYYQYGYLPGWSNSGFDEETIMYIDDVVFSTEEINSKY